MKPTWGLVPYTGIMPIEATIDHTGPMTRTVHDNALLLEVIAGEDGLDPRQYAPRTAAYTEALEGGVEGMRIGLVKEGFGHPESEPDVDDKVREGARRLRELGAVVEEVSVPIHAVGRDIWTPTALEGLTYQMMKANGMGTNYKGLYVTSLLDAHAKWRNRADELFVSVKVAMLLGEFMTRHYGGHYYAKSQNLIRKMRAKYDDALAQWDLLMMPTIPMKATVLPARDAGDLAHWEVALNMNRNTSPFCATGHPAINVPCGLSEGLPVGLMLIGRHFDEAAIYRAARAFEQSGDWKAM
jgi:amidase